MTKDEIDWILENNEKVVARSVANFKQSLKKIEEIQKNISRLIR